MTPFRDSSDYFTTLPSEYVTPRVKHNTPIMLETNEFTTGTGKADEVPSTSDSTRLSNLFKTADISTHVYRNTTITDGFD